MSEEFNPNQLVEEVHLPFWLTVAVQTDRPELLKLAPADVDPNVANFIRVLMLTNQKLRQEYNRILEEHEDCDKRLATLIKDVETAIKQFQKRMP
jgi:hypothetical protein